MKRQYNLLLHPAFIISLFLLLLNDISLKYQFANAFTGKLSDFTGLFVFSLFCLTFLPLYKKSIALMAAILFAWWKSPLSTFFIEWWNGLPFISITRVIDYSDLLALVVLPFAVVIAEKNVNPVIKYKKLFIPLIGCITIFSFCFTSMSRYGYRSYAPDEIAFDHTIDTPQSEQQILDNLRQQNIPFTADSLSYYPAREFGPPYTYVMRITTAGPDSVKWIPIDNRADSALYVRRNEGLYYTLSKYNFDGIELENVKIFIFKKNFDKDTRIRIERFRWTKSQEDFTNKARRKLKKHFERFFKK
ncbi:hypothetical protein LZZ85_17700 [Terrimonas sp. NA20]|uniref:Uncharacterized protein n=1 Tax=Terrimonas ginsenosidimutans TaxID=2908004 RepID=A0ABS9KUZ1_9BACT|nr:hypothetical protein [Terrimonas ginsenosidimutans]MCG2616136.1 hypothetical protein [Terrimonas ginsenosidimutans]